MHNAANHATPKALNAHVKHQFSLHDANFILVITGGYMAIKSVIFSGIKINSVK